MSFSLISVSSANADGTVNGYWLQDHVGDLDEALDKAARTEAANSHGITVAVVEPVNHPTPMLDFWTNRIIASRS